MTSNLNLPLTAKNGHMLEVVIAGRVSDPGPGKQSILSLDGQESMHMEWLKANTDLPFNVTVVADSGSGEFLAIAAKVIGKCGQVPIELNGTGGCAWLASLEMTVRRRSP